MNLQNLIAQLGSATNPLQMMMNLLDPNQKQTVEKFKNKPSQEQAEEIARKCNEMGITKEQVQQILGMFSKR